MKTKELNARIKELETENGHLKEAIGILADQDLKEIRRIEQELVAAKTAKPSLEAAVTGTIETFFGNIKTGVERVTANVVDDVEASMARLGQKVRLGKRIQAFFNA